MMAMELISVTMNVSTVLFQAQNASFSFNAIVVIVHNLYRMNVWNIKSHIKDMDSCMEVSYFAFRLTCVTSLIWRTSFDVAMAYHEIQLIQTLFHWGNDPTNMAFSLPDNGKMKYCTFGPIFAALSWVFFGTKELVILSDDVTFQRWPINTCFVVWRTLWLMSYLLAFSSTFQNCIFLIWSFTEINKIKFYALQISRITYCIHLSRLYQLQIDKETLHRNYRFKLSVKKSAKNNSPFFKRSCPIVVKAPKKRKSRIP